METNFTIIIAEDGVVQRGKLKLYVEKMGHTVVDMVSSGSRLIESCAIYRPDIVLLDIGLEKLDGLSAFRILRESGNNSKMIFVTGSGNPTHLLASYDLDSVDYILKPVTFERLKKAIDKAAIQLSAENILSTRQNEDVNMITVMSNRRDLLVNEKKILFVEKINDTKWIKIHLKDGEIIETRTPLKKILDQTSRIIFCPHRSFLVNMLCVEEVRADPVTKGNYLISLQNSVAVILLSRNHYEEFLQRQSELKNRMNIDGWLSLQGTN
ncbi:LytR/AlgR family response regulator transcription factor [Paenibacillus provencensis]|uniref:LytR/AlgR family response regulator transcription factor n=1 Tax=Paenibacillus provencensis TaxID=441151 RepID=A0ABW3Q243_9BACL